MEDLVSDCYSVCLIHMHDSVYKFEIFNSACDFLYPLSTNQDILLFYLAAVFCL